MLAGTDIVDGLDARGLHETFQDPTWPFVPHSLDGPFLCCNNEQYGGVCRSEEKVVKQGDRCSECRSMGRESTCLSSSLVGDAGPMNDGYDCVNKPRYGCIESVSRAGARCSLCVKEKRPSGGRSALHPNSFYVHDGTQSCNENADYDEIDPQVLIRNPARPGDE